MTPISKNKEGYDELAPAGRDVFNKRTVIDYLKKLATEPYKDGLKGFLRFMGNSIVAAGKAMRNAWNDNTRDALKSNNSEGR